MYNNNHWLCLPILKWHHFFTVGINNFSYVILSFAQWYTKASFYSAVWHVVLYDVNTNSLFCFLLITKIKWFISFLHPSKECFIMYPIVLLFPELIIFINYLRLLHLLSIMLLLQRRLGFGLRRKQISVKFQPVTFSFIYSQDVKHAFRWNFHIFIWQMEVQIVKLVHMFAYEMLPSISSCCSHHKSFLQLSSSLRHDIHAKPCRKDLLEWSMIAFQMNTMCRHYFQ